MIVANQNLLSRFPFYTIIANPKGETRKYMLGRVLHGKTRNMKTAIFMMIGARSVSAFVPSVQNGLQITSCVDNSVRTFANGRNNIDRRIDQELLKLNLSSRDGNFNDPLPFRKGNPILVEVVRFGPLGASVDVVAKSHNDDDIIPEDEEALGVGLIIQKEIGYFRASRGGLDVVVGEILPAYVDWVRDDGKINISLRKPGGRGKAEDLSKLLIEKLEGSSDGEIPVGDKSSPEEINKTFPGASKASFKRAVASLYKKGLVQPGAKSTKLM